MPSTFAPILSSQGYDRLSQRTNAMQAGKAESDEPVVQLSDQVAFIAEQLTFSLPAVDWTIEVDLFGNHRITVHFKGAEISVD